MPWDLSQLFYYRLIFLGELLVAEALFCHSLRRRSHFVWRLLASLAALVGITMLFPLAFYTPEYISLMFFTIFLSSVLLAYFCFDESGWNIAFCTIAAYSVQHLTFLLYNTLITNLLLTRGLEYLVESNPYSSEIAKTADFPLIGTIAYLQMYFACYWLAYYLFADRIKKNQDLHIDNHLFVILSGSIILFDVYFNMVTIFNGDWNSYAPYLEAVYNFATCIFALILQFNQLSKKETEGELQSIKTLWAERKNQYELSKKNIDIINVKCHDLKHQIHSLGAKTNVDSSELAAIEKALNIYDSTVKTGNEALDVILTEKALLYEKRNVHLNIIADGSALSFMEASDIYSLFGNAFDNALEAVEKEAPEKRNASFLIKHKGNMIYAHLENYFSGTLKLKDGIPETTKQDKDYHGFGFLSMKGVVEKYGGVLSVEVKDNTFNLNFLFPAPKPSLAVSSSGTANQPSATEK